MITLYGMGSPNVVKVYIALEELALPYTVAAGRRVHRQAVRRGVPEAQSERQGAGYRRSGRPRRQALHRVRIRRDPAVSCGEDREAAANEIRLPNTTLSSG